MFPSIVYLQINLINCGKKYYSFQEKRNDIEPVLTQLLKSQTKSIRSVYIFVCLKQILEMLITLR